MFSLADRWNGPLSTVEGITANEFNHWIAYYNIKREEQENAKEEQQNGN